MIRPATSFDIPRALTIYHSARQFMRRSGNTVQWVNGYPSEALLRPDVAAGRPVAEWFNPAAPAVKSGAVDPQALDAEQALDLLLAQPLLIRRPLISAGSLRLAGFDVAALDALLPEAQRGRLGGAPEGCSHAGHAHASCGSGR